MRNYKRYDRFYAKPRRPIMDNGFKWFMIMLAVVFGLGVISMGAYAYMDGQAQIACINNHMQWDNDKCLSGK